MNAFGNSKCEKCGIRHASGAKCPTEDETPNPFLATPDAGGKCLSIQVSKICTGDMWDAYIRAQLKKTKARGEVIPLTPQEALDALLSVVDDVQGPIEQKYKYVKEQRTLVPIATPPAVEGGEKKPREWLVIESSAKHAVFADDETRNKKGYIPRDVVEGELGIKIEPDGRATWFTREQQAAMRAHPEWTDTDPPGKTATPFPAQGEIDEKIEAIRKIVAEIHSRNEAREELPYRFFKGMTDAALETEIEQRNGDVSILLGMADLLLSNVARLQSQLSTASAEVTEATDEEVAAACTTSQGGPLKPNGQEVKRQYAKHGLRITRAALQSAGRK